MNQKGFKLLIGMLIICISGFIGYCLDIYCHIEISPVYFVIGCWSGMGALLVATWK